MHTVQKAALEALDKFASKMRLLLMEQHKVVAKLAQDRQPTRAAKELLDALDEAGAHATRYRELIAGLPTNPSMAPPNTASNFAGANPVAR